MMIMSSFGDPSFGRTESIMPMAAAYFQLFHDFNFDVHFQSISHFIFQYSNFQDQIWPYLANPGTFDQHLVILILAN